MNEIDIFTVLRPIVLSLTGVDSCILADPNAPSPDGVYATIRPIQSLTQRGQANMKMTNVVAQPNISVDVRAQVIAECSINFFRGDAMSNAQRMFQASKRPDVSNTLRQAGLGWFRAGPVNNLTALQSNQFEQRSQVSIFLLYETTDSVIINSIERVQVIVDNEVPTTLVDFEIVTPDAP